MLPRGLRVDWRDEDDDGEAHKDYSVLLAEADKIRADGAIAMRRLELMDKSEQMIERANEITAWKRRNSPKP